MFNQDSELHKYILEQDDYHSDKEYEMNNINCEEFLNYNDNNLEDINQIKENDEIYFKNTGKTKADLYEKNTNENLINLINENENETLIYEGNSDNHFKISKNKKFKPENIRIKIKVHYHKFIYSFFKDLIKNKFPKKKCVIRKIPHLITKNVSKSGNRTLMKMTLAEFLSQNVSSVYDCEINQNKKNIEKIKKLFSNSEEKIFLNMTYEEFYKKYYLSHNRNIVNFLSNKTIFFYEYLQSLNINERNNVDLIARKYFIEYFLDGKDSDSYN